MKRLLPILLVLTLAFSAFAATNGQTIYSVDDPVYKQIYSLYLAEGYGAPSSSGPWSGNELLHMMDKVSRADLAEPLQKVYDEVMAKLNPEALLDFDTVAFDVSVDLDLEAYYRSQGNKGTAAAMGLGEELNNILASDYVKYLTEALKQSAIYEQLAASDPTGASAALSAAVAAQSKALENIEAYASVVASYNDYISKNAKDPIIAGFLAEKELEVEDILLKEDGTDLEEKQAILQQNFLGETGFEAYAGKANSFSQVDDWFHSYQYRKPLIKVNFETWALDNFYGYFGLGLGETDFPYLYALKFNTNATLLTGVLFKSGEAALDEGLGKRLASSNIFGEPMKAVASVGGDRWNLVAGRDKLSWGVGETGNLMLSDSFPQHTFAKFATYHNVFKYTLLGTIYPYYNDFYTHGGTAYSSTFDKVYGQGTAIDGYKSLIAHRLEFSFWKNRVNFAVTEACMFRKSRKDASEGFTMAMINPFGFMHNEYNRINGNSLMVFEADVTPIKGLNVYAQFALDDFTIPGGDDGTVPSATGLLAGVRGQYVLGDGILKFNAEVVKTDPYLYLRGSYADVANSYGPNNKFSYGYGYDALYRHFSIGLGVINENRFITYKYGNDVKILQAKAAYEMPEVFEAGAGIFVKTSGVMDITSPWGEYTNKDLGAYSKLPQVKTPALVDPFTMEPAGEYPENDTVAAEVETVITLSGTYHTPIKNLDVYGYADFISFNNYQNVKGEKHSDVQATFGVKYSF